MSSAYQLPISELPGAIRAHRARRDLTQQEAADEIGVSKRALQDWEAGQTPRAVHRRAIRRWLSSGYFAEGDAA